MPVQATRLERLTFDVKHAQERMDLFEKFKTAVGHDGTPNVDNPRFREDFEETVAELAEAKAALRAHKEI